MSKIILRIPGTWPRRVDIIEAVARSGTGYLFADDRLYNTRTMQTFSTLVGEYNPQMEEAFRLFSTGNIDDATLSAIGQHTHSLYFVSHADSPDDARAAMRAADALLTSGGIAVLVESSGVVHTAPAWHALFARTDSTALYEAFVSPLVALKERSYYTCGMHNMGRRDAVISASIYSRDAYAIMQDFLSRTIDAESEIPLGSAFPATDQHSAYKVSAHEPCTTYPSENVYYNPHGMWRLEAQTTQ